MGLGELRYSFILVPLLFVFVCYIVSQNFALLGTNFLLSMIAGTIITVVTTSMIPLTGNSEGTYLAFTVGFALTFWGLSIVGFSGFGQTALWADNIASWIQGIPSYQQLHPNGTDTFDLAHLNLASTMPSFGGWSGVQIWSVIMVSLSVFYCLGLYLLVASRGK